MSAVLRYLSALHHDDLVCIGNGRETVRNHNYRFVFCQFFQCLLNLCFIFRVCKSGGLVQNDDRGILQYCSRNSKPLYFATGKIYTFSSNHRMDSIGEFFENIITSS